MDMGDNTWVNMNPNAYYTEISVVKHPKKREYAVIQQSKKTRHYMMNANSGTSSWYGMTKTKALELAAKLRKKHPNG